MGALIFRQEEKPWLSPPAHYSALSKMLVAPENSGTRHFDFRISIYQPGGYAEAHSHERAENIYYILKGTARVTLDGEPHICEPGTVIFIPPGVMHGIENPGTRDLEFVIVASPPDDMPRPEAP